MLGCHFGDYFHYRNVHLVYRGHTVRRKYRLREYRFFLGIFRCRNGNVKEQKSLKTSNKQLFEKRAHETKPP